MADSHRLPEANDTERQELLSHLKQLGLTTDDQLARMGSESPEEVQNFIDRLLNDKKRLQDDCKQLITIKDVIEKYLSRLIADMLDRRDVTESLQHGMKLYPSLRFISWLVEEEEQEKRDLTEFIKDLDLDSDYALPILYRWKYEYKPLGDIWWELERRQYGRENRWTRIRRELYYKLLRDIPQVSIQLLSRTKIVWNAREDIDDIASLAQVLLEICLEALSGPQERFDPSFLDRMMEISSETEKIMETLKALCIRSPQNVSEDSTNIQ